jgi:excisionase family DNA binding protein
MADTLPIRPSLEPERTHKAGAGLTVEDAARRYRVSPDKIRAWIARGEIRAINTAASKCGKPRWVIPPEAIEDFERRRTGGPVPKAPRRRRKPELVDYWPD